MDDLRELVAAINRNLEAGMSVLHVHKIQQSVEDFMNEAHQKNYCTTCRDFLHDYDHAKRCEDLDHTLIWKDPRPEEPTLNDSGETTL